MQVVLGLPYGPKIDIWSVGCILCELLTGNVLFANDSVQLILARMQSLLGPFPQEMLDKGREASKFFTAKGSVFERTETGSITYVNFRLTQRRRVSVKTLLSCLLFLADSSTPSAPICAFGSGPTTRTSSILLPRCWCWTPLNGPQLHKRCNTRGSARSMSLSHMYFLLNAMRCWHCIAGAWVFLHWLLREFICFIFPHYWNGGGLFEVVCTLAMDAVMYMKYLSYVYSGATELLQEKQWSGTRRPNKFHARVRHSQQWHAVLFSD